MLTRVRYGKTQYPPTNQATNGSISPLPHPAPPLLIIPLHFGPNSSKCHYFDTFLILRFSPIQPNASVYRRRLASRYFSRQRRYVNPSSRYPVGGPFFYLTEPDQIRASAQRRIRGSCPSETQPYSGRPPSQMDPCARGSGSPCQPFANTALCRSGPSSKWFTREGGKTLVLEVRTEEPISED